MTINLETDAVTEALHKVVAEKGGDYVYRSPTGVEGECFYSDPETGAPSCIVGHVVAALSGEAFAKLVDFEKNGRSFGASMISARTDLSLEYQTLEALYAAQAIQDVGFPWKDAQEGYDRVIAGENEEEVRTDIYFRKREGN